MVRTMVLASTMLAMLGAATSGIAQPAPALPLGDVSTKPQPGGWMTRNLGPVACQATKLGINAKQGPTQFTILLMPMIALRIVVDSEAATAAPAPMVIMVGDAQWTGFAKASGRAWIVSWPMTTPAEADAVQRLLDKMDTNRQLTMTVNGVQHSLDLSGFATMNPDFVQECFARFLTFVASHPRN
jgi:hypothetical protein